MTAKEKAKELVDKFNYEGKHYLMLDTKQCAIMAVEEILSGSRLFYIEDYKYWREVKQEIEKK